MQAALRLLIHQYFYTKEGDMMVSLEELQAHVDRVPIYEKFCGRVQEIREGYCKIMIPYSPALTNTWKTIHGGVYMTVADLTVFLALATVYGLDTSGNLSTVEIKTNFLNPSREDIYAEARIIKNGRSIVFGDVSITDTKGVVVSHSTVTYARRNNNQVKPPVHW